MRSPHRRHTPATTSAAHPAQHRVAEFVRWLNSRSEQLIVLVGHSSFLHSFTGQRRKRLQNCEVMTMSW